MGYYKPTLNFDQSSPIFGSLFCIFVVVKWYLCLIDLKNKTKFNENADFNEKIKNNYCIDLNENRYTIAIFV